MMDDNDLAQLPIGEYLSANGLVCVWCTNSQYHIDTLKSVLFSTWKVKYVACWYWIKVCFDQLAKENLCNRPSTKKNIKFSH